MLLLTHRRIHLAASPLILAPLFALWTASIANAQEPGPVPAPSGTAAPAVAQPTPAMTKAEQIAGVQRLLEKDLAELKSLEEELADLNVEEIQQAFQAVDQEYQEKKKRLEDYQGTGQADRAAELASEVELLEKKRQLARESADLVIEREQTLKRTIDSLNQKIARQRDWLARLRGELPTTPPPTPTVTATPGITPTEAVPAGTATPQVSETPQLAVSPSPSPAPIAVSPTPVSPTPSPTPAPSPSMMGMLMGTGTTAPEAATPAAPTPTPTPLSPELQRQLEQARAELDARYEALASAELAVQEISSQVATLREQVQEQLELRQQSRKEEEIATAKLEVLRQELENKEAAGVGWEELREVQRQINEAEKRRTAARVKVRERNDRLDELQTQLSQFQTAQISAVQKLEVARQDVESLEQEIRNLASIYNPRNFLYWFVEHGPRILIIIFGMILLGFLARILSRHIAFIATHGGRELTEEERENRKQTLTSVFSATARLIIYFGGIVMLLQEVGVPIAPLLGGAAVGGLAIAFGAQNLIRDYFTGFVILIENQYAINDVVRLCGTAGAVERITLRMTVLRDLEGIVHFIPNGEIKTVSNLTHGWSRAVFDIGVAYKEDVDRVIEVIQEVGKELKEDAYFKRLILEDLTMLGVDAMTDSAIVIKCFIKTRPLKQWEVKRAMLRRIKKRFDELGIEIPFPHRTIFHRYDGPRGDAPTHEAEHAAEMATSGARD